MKKGATGTYIALLVAVVILMFMLKQCSSPVSRDSIAVKSAFGDTLNVAIDYSPMSMYSYGDTVGGFNYDVIRQLAVQNNLKLRFFPVNTIDRALQLLDSGYCDIIVADLPLTAEYKKRFLFTEPTFIDRSVLVQRRDSTGRKTLASVLDLAGKTVTVAAGAPVVDRIRNLSREIGDTIYISLDSTYSAEQLVMLVAAGEIDLAVVNDGIARRLAAKLPEIDVSTNISFSQFQSWITATGDTLLRDSINAMLGRFMLTPEYDELLKRYNVSRPPAN
ncbi:MAG: transporter substrate-binding domain-containing protein [Muribaculaceae bacterium]|nr:transporter substrate-binding domain-containing protein [Muribaculaceae bacterium]